MLITIFLFFNFILSFSFMHLNVYNLLRHKYFISLQKKKLIYITMHYPFATVLNASVLKSTCILMFAHSSYIRMCRKSIICIYWCQLVNLPCSEQNHNLTRNVSEILTAILLCIYRIYINKSQYMFIYYCCQLKYYSIWVT